MIHHPLNGILPLLIVPLLTVIVKALKKPATNPDHSADPAANDPD